MVSAAWKDVRIPNVKNTFSNRAAFTTMPGMKPYMEQV